MERQSSFGSQSSAGSAFTSRSATTKLVKDAEKEQGLDNQGQSLLTALFGALYTLAKEKISDTASIAMLAIWVDFLMIFTLILMPEYPWNVNADLWIYKFFYYIQIHLPLAHTGYTFYLVIFYLLVAVLYASAIICVWVGWCFMNDSFPFLWPIKVARVVVSLFVSMFYIASLNIFLMACACKKHDGHWIHLVFGVDCLGFPHIIHAAFSIASGVIFFLVAFLLVLGDHELEPMSKSLLAAPHSMCELRALLCKTVITIADILLKPLPHVQVVLYTIACGLLFYYHARMVPHYVPWINVLRGGLNMVLAWVSLIACILTYTAEWHENQHDPEHPSWDRQEYRDVMTKVMAAGIPVFFFLGGGICWAHLVYAWRTALKFKVLPPGVKPRSIHRFITEFDVEIASRIGRIWDEEGVLDTAALDLAENVLKAGVAMKPHSVFMHIAYSNFLIEVRHNIQSGWNHLEQAKKLEPNLSYQFSIFTRVQEHKQKAAGGGGNEGSVDLVSYVEFQKNYRSLLVYHKASLVANREFWRLLTHETIPLERLGHSFKRIDEMEFMAEKTYKLVLDRYPTNAKLLKSYGKFLENVKNDPWGAARCYAEAEKQEEMAESAAAEIKIDDGEDGLAGLVDEKSALITIDSGGIIQTVNKACCQMLGYKKGDLEGKNVSCIMPAPFSMRHNCYLRNYVNTGKSKILNTAREMVALHKDRYVFPVSLYVSRFSGGGADSVFMGIMKPLDNDPEMIKAWLLTTGTMLCADQSFLDYAGWDPNELVGRAFSSLGVDSAELDDMIAQCATFHEDELKAGAVQLTTSIKHKYADSVPVHIKFELGGTESQRILVVEMKRLAETAAMAAFDHKGRCLYANTPLASMLGYKLKVMRTKDISQLLPQPYGTLHMKWMKDAEHMEAKHTPGSCRNGLTSVMLSSNGTPVYVKSTIMPHNAVAAAQGLSLGALGGGMSSDTIWSLTVERSSHAQLLNERRLQLLVSADGQITWATPGCPSSLFGCEPAALVGMKLSSFIDVFRDYESENAAGDVAAALAALLNRNTTRPGSSWRVGVSKNLQQQQQANGTTTSKSGGIAVSHNLNGEGMTVHRAAKDRIRPAIMTVIVPTEDTVSEEILAAAAGQEATVCLELWRADILLGVAEIVEGCSITRVEPSVGLLLGCSHTALFQTNLEQWVNVPAGTQLADLMGTKDAKKGGLRKSSRMTKYGPNKIVTGLHPDRRPVQIQLQATMKDGTHDDRLVLALKVTSPLSGAPQFLTTLIAAEAEGLGVGAAEGWGLAAELANLSSTGAQVPGLPTAKLSGNGGVDLLGTNTLTHRSNAGEAGLATARLVDLEVDEETGSKSGHAHGRTPATLAASPTDRKHHQGGLHSLKKHLGVHVGFGAKAEEAEQEPTDWDNPKTPGAKGMVLSSDSGMEEEEQQLRHRKKGKGQKHLTEEEAEAIYEAKGARKAKEWLDSGFGGFKKEDDDPDLNLPGAVDGSEGTFQLVHGRGHDDSKSGASGQAPDDIPTANDEKPAAEAAGSEQSASIAGDGGLVSDYSRGKRLRKLKRLLNSTAALQVVTGFRFKVVLLSIGILLLHIGSFAAIVGYIGTATSYLTELSAAGSVLDQMHRTATLSLVLEAAQRGYGFLAADTATYAEQLDDALTQYDSLHQGLYLGFSGLRSLDTSDLYSLWHNEGIVATNFLDGTNPTSGSTEEVSLFNLGSAYASAARDVHYAALHPNSQQTQNGSLSQSRQWLFLQANGPGVLYQAYLKNLDYMVVRAQDGVGMLQKAVLALLLIEGLLIIVLAVGLVVRLLGSVSIHRQALFSVFLAIPNNFLRTLASKSVSIGEEDGEEEDEEDKALQKAEEKKRKRKQRADAEGGDAATPGVARNNGRRTSFINIGPPDGTVYVGVNHGAMTGKGKATVRDFEPQSERQRLFNGKQLVTSAKSAYQLTWPFLLWGILVMVLYGVSYQKLGDINDGIIAIKMSQRSLAEASRLTYYGARIALEPDALKRAALQSVLWEQSKVFDSVYRTSLYGGGTLNDSQADGSKDDSTGSLFRNSYHTQLLFRLDGCLRQDQSGCLPKESPFHVVSHYGIDPMAQRLTKEAELLSLESAAGINPHPSADRCLGAGYPLNECRFACIWSVTWHDLHDGMKQLVNVYIEELAAAYASQRTLHVVLVVIMMLAGGAFLLMMLRPFLKHISKESRRCAELLAQLPPDMDVEGMVAATWSVVKEEQLIAERSGKTFINNVAGLNGVLGGLSFASIRASFTGHVRAPMRPMGNRLPDDEGRLFSPRQDMDQVDESYGRIPGSLVQAADHMGHTRFAAARTGGADGLGNGSVRMSLDMPGLPPGYGGPSYPQQQGRGVAGHRGSAAGGAYRGSQQGSMYEGTGRSGGGSVHVQGGGVVGSGAGRRNVSMQGAVAPGASSGGDTLRLRRGGGMRSPSKRAVHPVDDEQF